MHSWVGYELVKVLLKYGLSPKLWGDLNEWLPDLYKLFSYFGNKQRDSSKSPTQLITLFEKTEHCSYFGKLSFGKRTKFEKMANTTIPLVILTWLRQLQEHFFEQPENNPQIDWNDSRRYCNVPVKFAVSKGVNHVHMSKANNKNAFKIESFDSIKPNKKHSKKVVKSLFEWVERILYWESAYVQDITKSIEKGTKSTPTKYTMTDQNYQEISQDENINDEIDTVTPEDQQRKTPAQLMSTVSGFMINEIARMPKTTGQKRVSQKNIELVNNANQVAACLVEYVNKVGGGQKKFKSLEEMKQHMAKEAESNKRTNAGESSEEDEDDNL